MSRARDLADSADLNFDDGTLVIDSGNNRVGIGTTSPQKSLSVTGGTTPFEVVRDNTGSAYTLMRSDSGSVYIGGGNSSGSMEFLVGGDSSGASSSEAMRIDSSGNLLVGKTSPNIAAVGAELRANGIVNGTRSSDPAGYFNRTTNDGDIVEFRKDNTTVGSIGVYGSYATIGAVNTGLRFTDAVDSIQPHSVSTNLPTDGTTDLGRNNSRFKDLYLSGGVYLGGTGSANYLNDYEEGTYTPEFTSNDTLSCTYDTQVGHYQKVGNTVHVTGTLRTDAISGSTSAVRITLPFTSFSTFIGQPGSVGGQSAWVNAPTMITQVDANTNTCALGEITEGDAGYDLITSGDMGTGANNNRVYFSVTYKIA